MKRLKQKVRARSGGWKLLLVQAVLDRDLPLLFQDEALQLLKQEAGNDFGFDAGARDNRTAAAKMKTWASNN